MYNSNSKALSGMLIQGGKNINCQQGLMICMKNEEKANGERVPEAVEAVEAALDSSS